MHAEASNGSWVAAAIPFVPGYGRRSLDEEWLQAMPLVGVKWSSSMHAIADR